MGLFKKKKPAYTSPLGVRHIPQAAMRDNPSANTPIDFYTECVKDFHDTAASLGHANRGLIFIPELIPIGQNAVLSFLQNPFFVSELGDDPTQYYFAIMGLCLQAGIVFATKWHEDYAALQSGYVEQIIGQDGPAEQAEALLQSELGMGKEAESDFLLKIYTRWTVLHQPYWKLSDPRQYTFNAMLAAYQLGVSMILEKFGY